MRSIYRIAAIGIIAAAAGACITAKIFAAESGTKADPVIIEAAADYAAVSDLHSIKNATLEDEGESYPGDAYLSPEGRVTHPEWFEGDKLIKADGTYYLIKAKEAPEYGDISFSDHIDIGDAVSEEKNAFECAYASEPQTNPDNGETFRTLSVNGAMAINLKCSPDEINYLTVRLWGSDTGDTILWVCDPSTGYMNADNTRQPHRNAGIDRRDWVELNYNNTTPQFDGGFIYATYEIPEIYTRDREYVSLRLYSTGGPSNYSDPPIKAQTEPSRGIYDVFMTRDAAFDPADFGIYGGAYSGNTENPFNITDSSDMERQKASLKDAVLEGIEVLKTWQIYGEDAPSYMRGMITRMDWRGNIPDNETDWKNRWYSSGYMLTQNMTPLNMTELAAYAYKHAEELDVDAGEMLDRVVQSIDFLCRAQGSNGGFYSQDGWIGGPERREAGGNNLTGFGLRSAGKAILDVYDGLTDDILNAPIDSDADGAEDKTRREAWSTMLASARDYLIDIEKGYGHAPNQDMANSIAALRFDAVLEKLGGSALTKANRASIYSFCFGDEKNPVTSSYWISPKGTILENFGSVQGGYSGDYGSAAIAELSQLAEHGRKYYNYNYGKYIAKVYDVINNYYFTGKKLVNGEFVPQEYTEGLISNRNAYYPGTERYPIDIYGALTLENDTALKIISNYLEQQDISALAEGGNGLNVSNTHYEDNILDAANLYESFDAIVEAARTRDIAGYSFAMETDSEGSYAWADEMARNVVIKDNGVKIYMALNWRNPAYSTTIYNTPYEKDLQRIKANNLCRVHAVNDTYDSYGYAAMTTDGYENWTLISDTDGYMQALMICRYGDYTVIMNSYKTEQKAASDFETAAGLDRSLSYKDLISGNVYGYSSGQWHSEGTNLILEASSTLVLKPIEIYASEPVIKNGSVYTRVANNTEESETVILYTASYNTDGSLAGVNTRTVSAAPGRTDVRLDTPDADAAFVWDSRQKPIVR